MRKALVGMVFGLIAAGTASAQVTIYAVNNLRPAGVNSDALISFQSNNPAGWSSIGLTGANGVGFTGLDFAGVGGGLYGWANFASGTGSSPFGLYSINRNTGAATFIGGTQTVNVQDMSWNPVTNQMVALQSDGTNTNLLSVNLATGNTTLIGAVTGLPAGTLDVGLAYDSAGRVYIHDVATDTIYTGAGLAVSALHTTQNTNFSQGMTIDWSRNNQGYHAAIGSSPAFFSELYTFTATAGSYSLVGNFGTPSGTFPTVEGGDLAIQPVPSPASLALLGVGGLAASRRRRR